MNEHSQFSVDPSGKTRLSGPLTLDTVASLYYQANADATQGRHIAELDLNAVSRVDSSGLALLLEWQATAACDGRKLPIRNAPDDLLSLVNLCEASDLLAIEGRNQSESMQKIPSYSGQDAQS